MTRALALLMLLALPLAVLAQGQADKRPRTEGLFMDPCKNCQGKWLPNCGNRNCSGRIEVHAHLFAMEAAGKTDEQIKARMVELYGPKVLASPEARGLAGTSYAMPLIGLLLGGGVLLLWARRRIGAHAQEASERPQTTPETVTDEEQARVEEALGELD